MPMSEPHPASPTAVGTIAAIIINYNGGERVINCIRAVTASHMRPTQIIVVDNASTDGSRERIEAEFPAVELVRLPENKGLPAARNVGLRHASSDLAILLDNDVYVAGDTLARLARTLREYRAAVVCPRIVLYPECQVVQCDGAAAHFIGTMTLRHAYSRLDDGAEPAVVGACIGACLLVDRKLVLAAGGFDELYFFYFEDLEFSVRMRLLGHSLVCEPRGVVYHDRGRGTPGLSFRGNDAYPARRALLTHRHRLLTILTYYRLSTLLLLAPALLIYEGATLAFFVSRGWSGDWLGAWAWLISNWRLIHERRKRARQQRVIGDRELLSGGELPFAPGVLRSRLSRILVHVLSRGMDLYWRASRHLAT
jgi:GT2 family glycosyltransferase